MAQLGGCLPAAGSTGAPVAEAATTTERPGKRGPQVGRLPERPAEEPKPLCVAVWDPVLGEVLILVPDFQVQDALV